MKLPPTFIRLSKFSGFTLLGTMVDTLVLWLCSDYLRIKYVESTRELEDNARMQNCWKRLPHRLHKRARCYIMKISK